MVIPVIRSSRVMLFLLFCREEAEFPATTRHGNRVGEAENTQTLREDAFTDPFEGYFQEEMEDIGAGVTALWRLLRASRQHLLSFPSVEDQLSDVSQRIFLVNVV